MVMTCFFLHSFRVKKRKSLKNLQQNPSSIRFGWRPNQPPPPNPRTHPVDANRTSRAAHRPFCFKREGFSFGWNLFKTRAISNKNQGVTWVPGGRCQVLKKDSKMVVFCVNTWYMEYIILKNLFSLFWGDCSFWVLNSSTWWKLL